MTTDSTDQDPSREIIKVIPNHGKEAKVEKVDPKAEKDGVKEDKHPKVLLEENLVDGMIGDEKGAIPGTGIMEETLLVTTGVEEDLLAIVVETTGVSAMMGETTVAAVITRR